MRYDHSSESESGDQMNAANHGDSNSTRNRSNSSPASPGSSPTSSTQHKCSYCGQQFDRALSKHMPFCSKRCQQVDLGMWLNESYGLPHEGESSLDSYGSVDESEEDEQ